ncbi:HupE/UreJ family protein [Synechococcus sp. BIOS-E4-1]|uniref:HupE/UreJ family protein n=1 Tax=Synechococcus sp. BIOS-E4-1 TaxID=1400864 RepID=UPI00164787AC|nr:HupE/UreJ family protein [Synechococcus sp. BIOS-E4-1]
MNALTKASPLLRAGVISTAGLVGLSLFSPAHAHHPFGMGDSTDLSALQGLLSGIGHPLLGPDHLLFLLAIALIGLPRPRTWVLPLLAAGLGGSVLSQFIPLPDAVAPWAEALVSLTLAAEGLMALFAIPSFLVLPLVALHGFLLGSTIVGAEPTPLATYFLGLLIGQGALLLVVTSWSQSLLERIGEQGQRLGAGIWMGIGMAFAWVALID